MKIGYLKGNKIYDSPSESMLYNYYQKQSRIKSGASMSDSLNEFDAILLDKVYFILKERYKDKIIYSDFDIDNASNCRIYNTVCPTKCNNFEPKFEYISNTQNNICGYDYVYDCNINNVKRLTNMSTEYITENEKSIKIPNYYESPIIYNTYYPKRNLSVIDISRNATKTQLKQEDIINYIINEQ
mgnify:CR=1 FL=1